MGELNSQDNSVLKGYLAYLERSHSYSTSMSYYLDCKYYLGYLNLTKGPRYTEIDNLKSSTSETVDAYLNILRETKSHATVYRVAVSIRNFYKYLVASKIIDNVPTFGTTLPIPQFHTPEVLTKAQMRLLINSVDTSSEMGARGKAMLLIMYYTGAKATDVLEMKVGDVDFHSREIILKSNSDIKTDLIFSLDGETINALEDYLEYRRKHCTPTSDDPLFTSLKDAKLTRQSVWKIIRRCAEESPLELKIGPNTIRNTMAYHLLESGVSSQRVSSILGNQALDNIRKFMELLPKSDEHIIRTHELLSI